MLIIFSNPFVRREIAPQLEVCSTNLVAINDLRPDFNILPSTLRLSTPAGGQGASRWFTSGRNSGV
jgi:hypothetical protein